MLKQRRSASCGIAAYDGSPVRVGDRVTIAGAPSMRARPEILARSLLLPNGTEFNFGSATAYFRRESRASGHRCRTQIAGDVAAAKPKPTVCSRLVDVMSDRRDPDTPWLVIDLAASARQRFVLRPGHVAHRDS